MNAFKRAWRYITRKPTKTILLIVTFFLIGNLVILGLGVSQAADNAKILTRQRMRAAVSYEIDYDAFWRYADSLEDEDEQQEAYRNSPRLDRETALNIAQDERVKALNYLTNTTAYARDFDYVKLNNDYEENNHGGTVMMEDGTEMEYVEPTIMLYANGTDNMIELEEGTFTVTSGRYFDKNDLEDAKKVALITEQLAEQNNLRVGDTITVSTLDMWAQEWLTPMNRTVEEFDLPLEIIGIYNNANEADPASDYYRWMSPYENPQNIVLIPLSTFSETQREVMRVQYEYYSQQNPEWYSEVDLEQQLAQAETPNKVVYLLDDPLNVDDFVKDHEGDLADYTKLNANNEQFRKMARPLDTMSFFANFVVWIVVVNAVVIITLVTALTLKTREYEIGVLLSIGVSKVKIVLQLFYELILIALVGFTLAVGSGSLIAGRVGEAVLSYQTESDAQYEDESYNGGYYYYGDTNYFTEVTQEELLSEYEVRISPKLVGEIYILGAAVVLIAILVPSYMIMRLNPKQILLEQN